MTFKWATISLLFAVTASAQMAMDMKMDSSDGKFTDKMNIDMKRMSHDMANAPMNGNVDHDFVTMMIPHHQGAIDMAQAELTYGRDPAMRQLARKIVVDQQKEIDQMNLWLKTEAAAPAK